MNRSQFCSFCGHPLVGDSYTYWQGESNGLAICASCENQLIHCALCQRPMKAESSDKLCSSCKVRYPSCTACSKPVIGIGYHRAGRNEIYCQDCFSHGQRCAVCGVPIAVVHNLLSDSSPVCDMCSSTAIYDSSEARQIFNKVITITCDHLQLYVHKPPNFKLVERQQLDAMVALSERPSIPGVVEGGHLLGVYVKQARRREILVKNGLPKLLMTKVIAHEYGHAWQGENCPFLRDPLVIEGFCEWVSYKVLGILGAVKEQQRLVAASGFYGDGLRMMLSLEGSQNPQRLLEHIKSIR